MKRFITALLVFLITVGVIAISHAADWQPLYSSDKVTYSFDPTSIRQITTGKYSVWVRYDFTEAAGKSNSIDLKLSKPTSHALYKSEYDCLNESTGMLSWAYYAKDGSVLSQGTNANPTHYAIIPDSIGELIFHVTFNEYYKRFIDGK